MKCPACGKKILNDLGTCSQCDRSQSVLWNALSGLLKRAEPLVSAEPVNIENCESCEASSCTSTTITQKASYVNDSGLSEIQGTNIVTAMDTEKLINSTEHQKLGEVETFANEINMDICDIEKISSKDQTKNIEVVSALEKISGSVEQQLVVLDELANESQSKINRPSANSAVLYDTALINDLLEQSESEFNSNSFQADSELAVLSFSVLDQETMKIIFDVADDFLVNPDIENSFVEITSPADTKNLESDLLQRQLQATQSVIGANIINLKSNISANTSLAATEESQVIQILKNITLASNKKCIQSMVIDAGIVFTLSAVILVIFLILQEPYHWQALTGKTPMFSADRVALFGWFSVIQITTTFMYLLFTLGINTSTLGMDCFKIRAVHIKKRELTTKELMGRCLIEAAWFYGCIWALSVVFKQLDRNKLSNSMLVEEAK